MQVQDGSQTWQFVHSKNEAEVPQLSNKTTFRLHVSDVFLHLDYWAEDIILKFLFTYYSWHHVQLEVKKLTEASQHEEVSEYHLDLFFVFLDALHFDLVYLHIPAELTQV